MSYSSSFDTEDRQNICALDTAASYLEVVREDLTGPLQESIFDLMNRYYAETSITGRELFWEEIRHALRGLEGVVSDCFEFCDIFREYSRARFNRIWKALSFNERSVVIGDYKFQGFGDDRRVPRPNFLDARRSAWMQTKRRIEITFGDYSKEDKERLVTRMVDSADVGFAMCEYVFAIDDYEGNFKVPEVERLLEDLMASIRELVFSSKTLDPVEETTDETDSENETLGKDSAKQQTDQAKTTASEDEREPLSVGANGQAASPNSAESDSDDEALDAELPTEEDERDKSEDYGDDEDSDDDQLEDLAARKPDGYYPIDEYAAANAKRAISFDIYVPNSETRVYRAEVDRAREVASSRKQKVDDRYHKRITQLLERFERRLADWYDRRNRAEASYPSILIVGAGNFSNAKHAKKMERLGELYKERDSIFGILSKMEGVGSGGIRSDDGDAIEQLERKLSRLRECHEEMKRANTYLRRNGTWNGYDKPDFVAEQYDSQGEPVYFYLTNSTQEMRRIENRIELLKRQESTDYGDGWKFEGGIAKANKEESRLQLFFDSIPDRTTREQLRGRGFLWSPKNQAWQRLLSPDAIWAAKAMGYIPKDWRPKLLKKGGDGANAED